MKTVLGGAECWLCVAYTLKYCSVHWSHSEHDFIVLQTVHLVLDYNWPSEDGVGNARR